MSRFDVYQSEVESSHLQWGIVHTEKFFRENARKMEGKKGDFSIVKVSNSCASDSKIIVHFVSVQLNFTHSLADANQFGFE